MLFTVEVTNKRQATACETGEEADVSGASLQDIGVTLENQLLTVTAERRPH
jgi:HSP20 family molecular chaperone IbpA